MSQRMSGRRLMFVAVWALTGAVSMSMADVVTEWNIAANRIVVSTASTPLEANSMLAIVQTSVFVAANAISHRYRSDDQHVPVPAGASIEAAVGAANRIALLALVPTQRALIDSIYQAAENGIPEGPSKTAGIAVGERAARTVLSRKAADQQTQVDRYRPLAMAGVYVPTVMPAGVNESRRTPWLLTSPGQFRPGPPPALTGEIWARDFNEIKMIGSKDSPQRTAEQTAIARFWEATMPPIYHGLIRSVATMPGRDITQNARLFAMVTQATDDALIAVMDAKHFYNFWRPITAIRNGDIDNNDATERDSTWTPFITTPLHPEYPCAHCIVSGTIGTILKAEFPGARTLPLRTTSSTAGGAARSWATIQDFMDEVANARIYDGVHFRNSTEVGTAMGQQIGEWYAAHFSQHMPMGNR